MQTRKQFLTSAAMVTAGQLLLPSQLKAERNRKMKNAGVQLYSFREEMLKDATGTLHTIAALGFKHIESAGSNKGHYYGLSPEEMNNICTDLGMILSSGHVHIDDKWKETLNEAAESGQEYLICSEMPVKEETVDNYKKMSELFNKAGEDCNKFGIKFGYHNHASEFTEQDGEVRYDVLLKNTQANLVHMELDLGWVVAAGKDPLVYFKNYPGRFPLWHLKDMDTAKKKSVEFGKGQLDIKGMFDHQQQSGLDIFFVEQEDYAVNAYESMKENMEYLRKLDV